MIANPLVTVVEGDIEELIARARALVDAGGRRLLGITGAPGAGKSTIAARVVEALGDAAVLVPMDGFHLANAELERLGRRDRKGAIDTFDAHGYVALLRRLRSPAGATVYAPLFRREIEEPIACAIPVGPEVPLVVTEGNYLLVPDEPWAAVRGLLDEAWYVDARRGDADRVADRPPRRVRQAAGRRARMVALDRPAQRGAGGRHARARRRAYPYRAGLSLRRRRPSTAAAGSTTRATASSPRLPVTSPDDDVDATGPLRCGRPDCQLHDVDAAVDVVGRP